MLIPIYTVFRCHKRVANEYTPDPDGWTLGVMDGFTCWETMEEVKNALDSRFENMKNGTGLNARPIKNTLEIDKNGLVQGAIYYEQFGVEYQCYVAQLIIAKRD